MLSGCFVELSFPMGTHDYHRAAPLQRVSCGDTREWLAETHAQLHRLLPRPSRPYMTTEQMADSEGRPRDVYAWFDRDRTKMQGLTTNWWALQDTAQSIEKGYFIEQPAELWPGFEDVWIPVSDTVQLHGFLGLSRCPDGSVRDAACIVILPGLWGDNGAIRSRDVSMALVRSGYHALSLEPRGHGQTEARYPDVYYNYGVIESQDMMKVSEWLEDRDPRVTATGMVGFCWGANQALLAAWFDGRSEDDPSVTGNVKRFLEPVSPRRHYTAGIIAFSPVLRWEDFLDRMDAVQSIWEDLSPAMFQASTRDHMIRKRFPEVTGSLRRCIAYDFAYSMFGPAFPVLDGYRFLRLMPYRGQPAGDKLESARVPVLIVHSVNDPLQTAQEVVDLLVDTENPQVAGIVLPGGGHIGFQAYARRYFYSVIMNFFDPEHGAAAACRPKPHDSAAGA